MGLDLTPDKSLKSRLRSKGIWQLLCDLAADLNLIGFESDP
jgi:hypothetical protein